MLHGNRTILCAAALGIGCEYAKHMSEPESPTPLGVTPLL
nr:MAG TPA: hypothetical protein [Microviridae sp.]